MSSIDTSFSFDSSLSCTPTSPPKLSENASVEYFDLLHANILVVGQTGSGKSTFVETLKDPRHFSSFGVVSSTTAASLHDLGFRVGHDNYSLSVIDTPGFADTSGQSDIKLQTLILEFVKRGVTSLSMVLIALPMNRRIDSNHMDTIDDVLQYLGEEMRQITYVLGTHSEGRTPEEKKKWANDLYRDKRLKNLVRFTNKKFVWSGMLDDKLSGARGEQMLKELKRNQENIIKKAVSADPVPLKEGGGGDAESIKRRFLVFESAMKDLMVLRDLLPEMVPKAKETTRLRDELVQSMEERSTRGWKEAPCLTQKVDELLGDLTDEAYVREKCLQWEKVKEDEDQYQEAGGRLEEAAKQIITEYDRLHKGDKDLRNALIQRTLLDDAGHTDDDDDFLID